MNAAARVNNPLGESQMLLRAVPVKHWGQGGLGDQFDMNAAARVNNPLGESHLYLRDVTVKHWGQGRLGDQFDMNAAARVNNPSGESHLYLRAVPVKHWGHGGLGDQITPQVYPRISIYFMFQLNIEVRGNQVISLLPSLPPHFNLFNPLYLSTPNFN